MNNTNQQLEKEGAIFNAENVTESTPPPTPPVVSAPTHLNCSFCDKQLPLDKYKKCPCKTTFYCMNSGCQKEHWKVHKTEHRKIERALNADKNEGEEKDDTKSGSKNKTSSPTIQRKPIQEEEKDECPICLDDIPMDATKFVRCTSCGKGLHHHCAKQLKEVKTKSIRDHCPLCRTKLPTTKEENIKRLQKWVKKKKAWAQCSLGNCYVHGEYGVKRDVKRAFVLLKLASEQGDANAQYNVGVMYRDGKGTKPDVKRAFELFTLAAEKGLADAQYNVGCMYANGQGVEQSFTTAREWCAKAAAQGDEEAIAALPQIDEDIRRTTTTSTDNKKETSSNTSTPDDNDTKSTSSTTQKQPEEEQDECPICLEVLPKLGSKFLRNACCGKGIHFACEKKKGASKSMNYEQKNSCCLCRTPANNPGTKEDIKELNFWVDRGKGWSMSMLANRYTKGKGVSQNDKRALELYTMAAELDYVDAIYNLGAMYGNGQGTEQDIPKAKELFMKAATLGHVGAILALKKLDKIEGNTTPTFTPIRTSCSYCGVAHAPPNVKVNPCSGCHSVFYCSKEHQIFDWKLKRSGHKKECKKL